MWSALPYRRPDDLNGRSPPKHWRTPGRRHMSVCLAVRSIHHLKRGRERNGNPGILIELICSECRVDYNADEDSQERRPADASPDGHAAPVDWIL